MKRIAPLEEKAKAGANKLLGHEPDKVVRDPPPTLWKDMSLLGGPYSHLRPSWPLAVTIVTIFAGLAFLLVRAITDPSATTPTARDIVGSQPLVFGVTRIVFSGIIFLVLHAMLTQNKPKRFQVSYFPDSKLVVDLPELPGFRRLTTFTTWNWMLIGIYLFLVGTISLLEEADIHVDAPSLYIALWVIFEICVSCAMLVTTIVTFYLVPLHLRTLELTAAANKKPVQSPAPLLCIIPTAMHNLNLTFIVTELLMNRLPVNLYHIPAASLWGLSYILFSWWYMRQSGVVFYNFLDSTLPARKSIAFHLGLMAYLSLWFAIVYGVQVGVDTLLETAGVWAWVVVHLATIPIMKVDFAAMRKDYRIWTRWFGP